MFVIVEGVEYKDFVLEFLVILLFLLIVDC